MRITDYPELLDLSSRGYFVIETDDGTKSLSLGHLVDYILAVIKDYTQNDVDNVKNSFNLKED